MARAQCHYDFNQVDTDCKSTDIFASATAVSYTDHNPFQHLLRLSSWGGKRAAPSADGTQVQIKFFNML